MLTNADKMAVDLITRTETAVEQVCHLAVDTGVTFTVTDIADAVERALPPGYPTEDSVAGGRRSMIESMAQDILSGSMYENPTP